MASLATYPFGGTPAFAVVRPLSRVPIRLVRSSGLRVSGAVAPSAAFVTSRSLKRSPAQSHDLAIKSRQGVTQPRGRVKDSMQETARLASGQFPYVVILVNEAAGCLLTHQP